MARKHLPSFDLYYDDFMSGTYYLSLEATGAYIRLLCKQWTSICLPNDLAKLAAIANTDLVTFQEVWKEIEDKFTESTIETPDGELRGLVNERLNSERVKALGIRLSRSKAGRKGGQANAKQKGKQKHSKGKRKMEEEVGRGSSQVKEETSSEQVDSVIAHYRTYHPRSKPGKVERDKIRARLKEGITTEDLCRAIDGCHVSPYHCGQNEMGTKYQGLELIVRDSAHVNRFIEIAENPPEKPESQSTRYDPLKDERLYQT
jgi:uncharacterized protein YdaU (DUF1376 family)